MTPQNHAKDVSALDCSVGRRIIRQRKDQNLRKIPSLLGINSKTCSNILVDILPVRHLRRPGIVSTRMLEPTFSELPIVHFLPPRMKIPFLSSQQLQTRRRSGCRIPMQCCFQHLEIRGNPLQLLFLLRMCLKVMFIIRRSSFQCRVQWVQVSQLRRINGQPQE
jgi:hypothetical protein